MGISAKTAYQTSENVVPGVQGDRLVVVQRSVRPCTQSKDQGRRLMGQRLCQNEISHTEARNYESQI